MLAFREKSLRIFEGRSGVLQFKKVFWFLENISDSFILKSYHTNIVYTAVTSTKTQGEKKDHHVSVSGTWRTWFAETLRSIKKIE